MYKRQLITLIWCYPVLY